MSTERARLRVKEGPVVLFDYLNPDGTVSFSEKIPWSGSSFTKEMYDSAGELIAVVEFHSTEGDNYVELRRGDGTVVQREAIAVTSTACVVKDTSVALPEHVMRQRLLAAYNDVPTSLQWGWRVGNLWVTVASLGYLLTHWELLSFAARGILSVLAAMTGQMMFFPMFPGLALFLQKALSEFFWAASIWGSNKLAEQLLEERQFAQAERVMERALVVSGIEQAKGISKFSSQMARIYRGTKKYDLSVWWWQRHLDLLQHHQGERHLALLELAQTYFVQDNIEMLAPVLQEVLRSFQSQHGWAEEKFNGNCSLMYPRFMRLRYMLGVSCLRKQRFVHAETHFVEALKFCKWTDERNHTKHCNLQYLIALCQSAQGNKNAQAEANFRDAMEFYRLERSMGRRYLETQHCCQEFMALLRKMDKHDEAKEWESMAESFNLTEAVNFGAGLEI